MTEISFPVVDKPLSEDEWKMIALGFGQGVIDRGGWPYALGTRNNVDNTVTINVDQVTGRNEAILSGFVHRIDSPKVLTIPAVTTTTTYEVGLVYDPLKHSTAEGPITLSVWIAPGDFTQGKNRMVLYRITRNANQVLSDAAVQENRQRVSPQISVNAPADLPKVETVLVDTVALVRTTNEWYRLNKATNGTITWTKVSGRDADLENATYLATPNTIAKRADNGGIRVVTGTHSQDAVNVSYLDAALGGAGWVAATAYPTGNSIVRRWPDGVIRVGDGSGLDDALNIREGNARYAPRSHRHNGADIDGTVPWESVRGSTWAYNTAQSGTVYTVSVNSSGQLMRFTSKREDKGDVRDLDISPRRVLAVVPKRFRRRLQEDRRRLGERVEWGVIADDELVREDGTPELVLTEVDKDGVERPESWDVFGQVAAHQLVLRWEARRVDTLVEAVKRVAEQTGVDLSDLLPDLEG